MSSPSLQETLLLIGQPVAGNPTQFVMEKAFADAGLDWRYLTVEVPPESLGDAVRGICVLGFRGGNVTVPHKVAIVPLLDGLSDAAEQIGAVNCLVRRDNLLTGENTDGKGFVASLKEVIDPAGKKILILGAGGAARAIAVELAIAGTAEIIIANRTPERGQALVQWLTDRTEVASSYLPWHGDLELPAGIDVLVQATSIGLNEPGARVPLAIASLSPEAVVADVVFNPTRTILVREAADHGCRVLGGLEMLVHQAAICFRLWTNVEPDAAMMREAIEEYLSV